jgi:Flp pilus assembly pilin Flp
VQIWFSMASRMWTDEGGATAIEYAVIAGIMGLAIIPMIGSTTDGIAGLFTRISGYFANF